MVAGKAGKSARGGGKGKIGKTSLGKLGKAQRGATSRSSRAGLQFPVGRIHRFLKSMVNGRIRIGGTSSVYCAAILEYLTAEILELAGNTSKEFRMRRITPRHLQMSIRGDDELDTLMRGTIAGGGVIPHIHKNLLEKGESE